MSSSCLRAFVVAFCALVVASHSSRLREHVNERRLAALDDVDRALDGGTEILRVALAEDLYELMREESDAAAHTYGRYLERLNTLTADSWRAG